MSANMYPILSVYRLDVILDFNGGRRDDDRMYLDLQLPVQSEHITTNVI